MSGQHGKWCRDCNGYHIGVYNHFVFNPVALREFTVENLASIHSPTPYELGCCPRFKRMIEVAVTARVMRHATL